MSRAFLRTVLWILLLPLLHGAERPVQHSPAAPRSGEKVVITLHAAAESPILEYQVVSPGSYIARKDPAFEKNWASLPMQKAAGAENRFTAEIPASVQVHRRLVRYRIRANGLKLPPAEDAQPNFAYFVYDGVPGWNAAIDPSSWDPRKNATVNFPPEVMSQVQTYFLIAKIKDVENATWHQPTHDKAYRYTGTFVADGKVYDHVPFRARGGDWRYAMGKNMWKFNFNKGHHLEARDDYGQRYGSKWGKLNLRSCIQQGDYGRRGEQGMYEAVGFRLFNLVGADAPRTHWITLRIVGEKDENPKDQYRGDFWGLYLAIENEDGDFLEEHRLPDGNVYKMKFGTGELSYQGKAQPADRSDLQKFLAGLRRPGSEAWWRQNVDLPRYYSYRAIVEGIHHYDIGFGKNYDYYYNPKIGKWCVIPWDIDLTWGDHMFGNGRDPFYPALNEPAIKLEYQNRVREVRDLLFNADETGRLIDECAAIIHRPNGLSIVDADRMKWDYHPIMSSQYAMDMKAGKGLFYQAVRSRDFPGMVQQMKDYVNQRATYLDRRVLAGSVPPEKPVITYTGPAGFPANRLTFKATDPVEVAATEWRLGRIDKTSPAAKPKGPGHYEISAAWHSGEISGWRDAITLPASAVQAGGTYRARCRIKDKSGRWSHWSELIELTVGPAK